jgi:hypothetical protein
MRKLFSIVLLLALLIPMLGIAAPASANGPKVIVKKFEVTYDPDNDEYIVEAKLELRGFGEEDKLEVKVIVRETEDGSLELDLLEYEGPLALFLTEIGLPDTLKLSEIIALANVDLEDMELDYEDFKLELEDVTFINVVFNWFGVYAGAPDLEVDIEEVTEIKIYTKAWTNAVVGFLNLGVFFDNLPPGLAKQGKIPPGHLKKGGVLLNTRYGETFEWGYWAEGEYVVLGWTWANDEGIVFYTLPADAILDVETLKIIVTELD